MVHHNAEELKALGLAVRRRREGLAVSQEALADHAHLHRTYVGSVERGERNVTYRSICALAEALGVKPSRLLAEAESLLDKWP